MKIKHYFLALIPICIATVALRIAELIFAVEPETGFYAFNNVLPAIFNLYCVLACIFLLLPMVLIRKEKKPVYRKYYELQKPEKWTLLAASALILAGAGETYAFALIQKTGDVFGFELLILLFAILTVLFAVLYATGSKLVIKNSVASGFSIVFTFYYLLRLFDVFLDPSTILAKAYTPFSVLFLAAATMFFLNFSKMLAGTPSKKYLYAFGFCTIFFGSIRLADLIVKLIPKNPYQVGGNILTYLADCAIALAVLFTLLHLATRIKKEPETK